MIAEMMQDMRHEYERREQEMRRDIEGLVASQQAAHAVIMELAQVLGLEGVDPAAVVARVRELVQP